MLMINTTIIHCKLLTWLSISILCGVSCAMHCTVDKQKKISGCSCQKFPLLIVPMCLVRKQVKKKGKEMKTMSLGQDCFTGYNFKE